MRVFGGRPTAVSFSGVFLPSVDWELKVEGAPWRSLEADPEHGSLIRSLRRNTTGRLTPAHAAAIDRMLRKSPERESVRIFQAAIAGDEVAVEATLSWGPWRTFALGIDFRTKPHVGAYVELERKLLAADTALSMGDFPAVAELLAQDAELRPYWSDSVLDALKRAERLEDTILPRLMAYLELQISCIARAACSDRFATPSEGVVQLEALLELRDLRPGQQLMRWLRQYVGVKSLSALLRIAEDGDPGAWLPSEATFKRWCSGEVFPPVDRMRAFVDALLQGTSVERSSKKSVGELDVDAIGAVYWATRRMEHAVSWLRYLEPIPGGVQRLLQLYGHDNDNTSQSWVWSSYRRWSTHWRNARDGACFQVL